MKASKNSIHARIYKYVYSEDLPTNLCPYFWKVLLGIILIVPSFITRVPLYIVFLIAKVSNDEIKNYQGLVDVIPSNTKKWIESIIGLFIFFIVCVIVQVLYIEFQWIKWLFNCYSYESAAASAAGFFNSIIGIIFIGMYIKYLKEEKSEQSSDNPSIIKEYIKAKYNKYCPKIDWDK